MSDSEKRKDFTKKYEVDINEILKGQTAQDKANELFKKDNNKENDIDSILNSILSGQRPQDRVNKAITEANKDKDEK